MLLPTKLASTGLALTADQCVPSHPDGRDLCVPATRKRRKVEASVGAQATAPAPRQGSSPGSEAPRCSPSS